MGDGRDIRDEHAASDGRAVDDVRDERAAGNAAGGVPGAEGAPGGLPDAECADGRLSAERAGALPVAGGVPVVEAPHGSVKEAAGKAALAAVLAGSVTAGAAAITPDQIHLPEPTPIVYVIDQPPAVPDTVVDDEKPSKASLLERLLQFGKFILLALALVAAIVLGITQGCASCAGPLVAPVDLTQSAQSSASSQPASSQAAA